MTHWLTFVAFIALLVTGGEIVISHPRFYWGEVGNVNTKPLFVIPIPSSRDTVPTQYNYVMPDQNGWSRYLHFEAAWAAMLTALVYGIYGVVSGHFRKNLFPERRDWRWRAYRERIAQYLRRRPPDQRGREFLQRVAAGDIYGSDLCFVSAGDLDGTGDVAGVYSGVSLDGGAVGRTTIGAHDSLFSIPWLLLLFLMVHVAMVAVSGFWRSDAGHDHWRQQIRRRTCMNPITRRKLISGGMAATVAGVAGWRRQIAWQSATGCSRRMAAEFTDPVRR